MFNKLTDFSYRRNWKEAIGFYIAYFILGLVIGGLVGALSGVLNPSGGFDEGLKMGSIVAVLLTLTISTLVLTKRGLSKSFGYIILVPLSGILAILGGGFLGLILPAFMTTREIRKQETKITEIS
jgi:hypothetical protein